MSKGKKAAIAGIIIFAVLVGSFFGVVGNLLKHKPHERTSSAGGGIAAAWQLIADPRAGFPNKDKIVVLCMGIDDNWTDNDVVYTKDSRTDTLFVLTLDLVNKKATMLSIPRDTYAHISGTNWNFKINAAYGSGGPKCTEATVQELLGIQPDYYVVLNIDATRKMVDSLGGVDVDVQHEMHYHDKWGHLSIDLQPGLQHLNGDQAVGFARYRHGDAGAKPSPEDGDDKRMARQHVLMRAMIQKGKSFANVMQAGALIDTAMSSVQTDMTRSQLADLVQLFHSFQPDQLLAGSLPGDDFRGTDGAWLYRIDPDKAKLYTSWLVDGDTEAAKQITSVKLTDSDKKSSRTASALAMLQASGFASTYITQAAGTSLVKSISNATQTPTTVPSSDSTTTVINDSGVEYSGAADAVANALNLTHAKITHIKSKPNKSGWSPPPSITVILGTDFVEPSGPAPAPV